MSEAVTCLKPAGCGVCGSALPARARRWCSPQCRSTYYVNHRWTEARCEAMCRTKRRCVGCRSLAVEVDHITERHGFPIHLHTCLHHQDNLRPLCHDCHVNRATRFPSSPTEQEQTP